MESINACALANGEVFSKGQSVRKHEEEVLSALTSKDRGVDAVGYVRVSTDEQARAGYSLDEQEREIRTYAEQRGWTLVDTYIDRGVSGRKINRPEYQRLLSDAEAGKSQVVIVWRLDRFGRRASEFLRAVEDLEGVGVEVVSVREQMDTTTPSGRAMRGVLAVFAQAESEATSERTKSNLAARRRGGRRAGGPAPYGFDYARNRDDPADKGTLAHNALEAPIVTEIYRLFRDGWGITRIFRHLNSRGVPTKKGARWAQYQVTAILDNPLYAGLLSINGELTKALHEPIVSHDEWLATQGIRQARREASGGGRGRRPSRRIF